MSLIGLGFIWPCFASGSILMSEEGAALTGVVVHGLESGDALFHWSNNLGSSASEAKSCLVSNSVNVAILHFSIGGEVNIPESPIFSYVLGNDDRVASLSFPNCFELFDGLFRVNDSLRDSGPMSFA